MFKVYKVDWFWGNTANSHRQAIVDDAGNALDFRDRLIAMFNADVETRPNWPMSSNYCIVVEQINLNPKFVGHKFPVLDDEPTIFSITVCLHSDIDVDSCVSHLSMAKDDVFLEIGLDKYVHFSPSEILDYDEDDLYAKYLEGVATLYKKMQFPSPEMTYVMQSDDMSFMFKTTVPAGMYQYSIMERAK